MKNEEGEEKSNRRTEEQGTEEQRNRRTEEQMNS